MNQSKATENLNVRVGREQPARSLNVKFGISVVCVGNFCIFAALKSVSEKETTRTTIFCRFSAENH